MIYFKNYYIIVLESSCERASDSGSNNIRQRSGKINIFILILHNLNNERSTTNHSRESKRAFT